MVNIVKNFDIALYSFLGPIMAPIFFPNQDPIVQLILIYGMSAVSIFMSPLGSLIFGVLAKYLGAKNSLLISLLGLSIFTLSIGLIPGYQTIGIYAPILLIVARMFRAIFSSGEITIARMYIMQNKKHRIAFRASYLFQVSAMLGVISASFFSSLLINWRISFIIADQKKPRPRAFQISGKRRWSKKSKTMSV